MPFCRPKTSSRKRRGSRVLIAATALLGFAGCANQGAPLLVEGKPVSGQVRLTQEQVGYMGSGNDRRADTVGFHRPTYLAGGRLNVGTGVLDYQGSGYAFGVRGLGAEGIEVANIEAMGEVYGLERLQDFPGTYVQAHQNHRRRSLVEECKRCDYAPCSEGRRDLDRGRRRRRI